MLMISIPYRVEVYKDSTELTIKSLDISVSGDTLQVAMELARAALSQVVTGRISKESFIFEQNHTDSGRGLLLSTHWPDLLNRALEVEPLPDTKDAKSERQKRLETQDHLSSLK